MSKKIICLFSLFFRAAALKKPYIWVYYILHISLNSFRATFEQNMTVSSDNEEISPYFPKSLILDFRPHTLLEAQENKYMWLIQIMRAFSVYLYFAPLCEILSEATAAAKTSNPGSCASFGGMEWRN